MRCWLAAFILSTVTTLHLKSRVNKRFIRGVEPEKLPFYRPAKEFRCLDSSRIIPYNWVNDDYCDCRDGSDEPGTAACPNAVFYCTNTAFRPYYILSSRVNDGVCDCCDGSDEYSQHVLCVNNCKELGERMKQHQELKVKLLAEGHRKYLDYCRMGAQIKANKKLELESLELDLMEAERLQHRLEEIKNRTEDVEREMKDLVQAQLNVTKRDTEEVKNREQALEAFKLMDANLDKRISSEELEVFFGRPVDGIYSDLEDPGRLHPPSFNLPEPVTFEEFLENVWTKFKGRYEEKKQISNHDEGEDGDDDRKVDDETNVEYDDKTKEAIKEADAARKAFSDHDTRHSELKDRSEKTENLLSMDSGEHNEFLALYDRCFELADGGYVYALCPLQHATQKNKGDSEHTILGKWKSWIGGKGDRYSVMHYADGDSCWKGPNRSVEVQLECGSSEELVSVSEPIRCEYEFIFRTSAACSTPPPTPPPVQHDPADL